MYNCRAVQSGTFIHFSWSLQDPVLVTLTICCDCELRCKNASSSQLICYNRTFTSQDIFNMSEHWSNSWPCQSQVCLPFIFEHYWASGGVISSSWAVPALTNQNVWCEKSLCVKRSCWVLINVLFLSLFVHSMISSSVLRSYLAPHRLWGHFI